MAHTTPTRRRQGLLLDQHPAPPISRADLLTELQGDVRLQRHHWVSDNYNVVQQAVRIFVEWVIPEEVPNPDDRFLDYPVRRAFIDDRVQVRVQLQKFALSAAPRIAITLHSKSRHYGPTERMICSDAAAVGVMNARHIPSVHRPLKRRRHIGRKTTAQTEQTIYFEVDAAKARSFIVTTVMLPPGPNPDETEGESWIAEVEISDQGRRFIGTSPPIEARRWWARPSVNLGIPRVDAPNVVPLVDGEAYFAECNTALRAAQAGDNYYLASWSFNALTMITGGQAAIANAKPKANTTDVALNESIAAALRVAAQAGADIYVLFDHFNASMGTRWLDDLQNDKNYFGAAWARIHMRSSRHPVEISVGAKGFRKKEQLGSYHEKYLCRLGAAQVALIGGIDFMPDRMSPYGHAWRHDNEDYIKMTARHVYDIYTNAQQAAEDEFDEELALWHDAGIRVDGPRGVHYLVEDFIRRWNDADPANALAFPPAPPAAAAGVEPTIQLVKTDRLKRTHPTRPATARGRHIGTLDAMIAAVRTARHYIYLENQYVRDPTLCEAMCAALAANPLLQIMVVIPFETEEAARAAGMHFAWGTAVAWWQYKEIELRGSIHGDHLQWKFCTKISAAGAGRVGIYGLAAALAGATEGEQIYPHIKTMIVDDTWAYIGSANVNGRSMQCDGESGYVVHDRALVTAYRKALWEEHFGGANPWFETAELRRFFQFWDGHALKDKDSPDDCTPAELTGLHAVEIDEPPRGQKYNGPGSWFISIDDYV